MPGTQPFELEESRGLPGQGLRFVQGVGTRTVAAETVLTGHAQPLPDWISRQAPAEPDLRRALAPSQAEGAETPSPSTSVDARLRFRRGVLIHRLLQLLPDLAVSERPAAAERLLAAIARDVPSPLQAEIAASVLALLERPEFAAVFGPESRAEQAICGTVGGRPLVGQIDRLVVTPDEILVVDLKSNRLPPADVRGTPASYLAQLSAYRSLLLQLYPGRRVRAALLWTEVPRLDEVPTALLERHALDAA